MRPEIDLAMGVLGLIVGSFANVCISRLPRHESLLRPGSCCPHCGAAIRWYDNIPLLSFFLLRGRCRGCGARISWRYPLVELLTAALFVQSVSRFGITAAGVRSMVLGTLLLIVFFTDLDHYIIPNRVTYPGIVVGLLFAALQGWPAAAAAAVTAAALGGGFVFLNVVSARLFGEEGMGLGDAKLAAMIGAFLSWPIAAVAIFLGIFLGGTAGAVLLALRKKGRREHIPFGPALATGALLAMWWGPALLQWYLNKLAG
jgi:leader peptidase (prepilin peptidase) / N-methyltransferase